MEELVIFLLFFYYLGILLSLGIIWFICFIVLFFILMSTVEENFDKLEVEIFEFQEENGIEKNCNITVAESSIRFMSSISKFYLIVFSLIFFGLFVFLVFVPEKTDDLNCILINLVSIIFLLPIMPIMLIKLIFSGHFLFDVATSIVCLKDKEEFESFLIPLKCAMWIDATSTISFISISWYVFSKYRK